MASGASQIRVTSNAGTQLVEVDVNGDGSGEMNIQVVGTATNGREAIEQAQALKPDVITMDYERLLCASPTTFGPGSCPSKATRPRRNRL